MVRLDSPEKKATEGQGTDTGWFIAECPHRSGVELAQKASRGPSSPAGWLPGTVPGLVTLDLLRAGRIADPYFGERIQETRFIEERDFVYRTELDVDQTIVASSKRARLVFDSLDTFATVFVNGKCVASHENQFRRLFVDVTDVLVAGKNYVAIAFEASAPAMVRRAGEKLPYWNEPWERLYVRKSQMSFGWDWAPRLPTVGIPGSVRLELSSGAFSDDLWLVGEPVGDGGGHISARADYHPHDTFTAQVALSIDGECRVRENIDLHAGHTQTVSLSDTLAAAHLWQPRELGEAHLYRVELTLLRDGVVVHRHAGRVGIRRLELHRGTPEQRRFELRVNGHKIFAKGENWIPPDLLHTRPSDAELRQYLELLAEGGVNLVRVWGGGIIERPAFYEACDELGLLVWQDFPYACGIYPQTDEFLREAALEASDIVRRLRSHPSVVLWCGNNENEVLAEREAPEARLHPLYYQVLRDVTARLDPHRPYWPGSPASESDAVSADSPLEGDRHNWDVWFHYADYDFIDDDARFCSEFGAQSFPQRETLESVLPREDLWSPGAVSRASGPSPGLAFARRGAQLEKLFSRSYAYANPAGLDATIAATQAFQADVIGRYVEHYRRLPHSGGVVIWNYTSTWPSICWALIDWYRRPKQAFYTAKRAFAPVVLGIEPNDRSGKRFTAYVSVDRPGTLGGSVTLSVHELASGRELDRREAQISLEGPGSVAAVELEVPASCDASRHALVAQLHYRGAVGQKDLRAVRYLGELRTASIYAETVQRQAGRGSLAATWTNGFVRLVSERWRLRVGVESFEPGVVWDDNYVDLLPGEERTLTLSRGKPKHLWIVADFGLRARLPAGERVHL